MNKSILTKREKEVFELLIKNKTTSEIATTLNISEKTVRNAIITIWCFLYTFFFFFIIHNSNPHASFYSESSLQ